MCARECVCVSMFVWVIVAYYCVWTYKWCLVYVCVKINTQRDKLEVVFRIEELRYETKLATGQPRKTFFICFFMYLCAYLLGVILTKEQNVIISKKIKLWFLSVNGRV